MSTPCTNNPDEVISKVISAKVNADKFDAFVNGTDTQTVQLGEGSSTPTIRNTVRQMMSTASELPNADVSGKSSTANGGSIMRTLAERFTDTLTFYDFGARGDGTTDDTSAVQAALNAGKPLTVRGRFKVSTLSIPSNSTLVGDVTFIEAGSLESGCFITVGQNSQIENIRVQLAGTEYLTGVFVKGGCRINRIEVKSETQRSSQAVELCGIDIDVNSISVRNVDRGIEIGAGRDIVSGTGKTSDNITHYSRINLGRYFVFNCIQGLKFSRAIACTVGGGMVYGLDDSIEYTPSNGYNGILIVACERLQIGNVALFRCLEHGVRIGGDDYRVDATTSNYASHDIIFGNVFSQGHGGSAFKVNPGHTARAYDISVNSIVSVDAGLRSREVTRRLSTLRLSFCDGFTCLSVVSKTTQSTSSQSLVLEEDTIELNGVTNVDIGHVRTDAVNRSVVCFHEDNDDEEASYNDQACKYIDIHSIFCRCSHGSNDIYLVKFYNENTQIYDVKFFKVYFAGGHIAGYFASPTDANIQRFMCSVYDRYSHVGSLTEKSWLTLHSYAAMSGENVVHRTSNFSSSNGLYSGTLQVRGKLDTSTAGLGAAISFPRKDSHVRPGGAIACYQEELNSSNCGLSFLIGGSSTASNTMDEVWRMTRTAHLYPVTDNLSKIGTSNKRVKEIFCATSTINTSDRRLKTAIEDPAEALMRAWGGVRFKVFQFADAVAVKGASARLHVGVVAQQVEEAFASEGLEAGRYGLFCYDEWPEKQEPRVIVDKPAVLDGDGNIVEEEQAHTEMVTVPAGNRYSIRYEEALTLESAYQRWLGEKRDAKIAELEARLNELSGKNSVPDGADSE